MATTYPPSTKQDILQQLLKQGRAKAQELAIALEISPQGIRRHLKELEAQGFIEFEIVKEGMGRPQHYYKLSREGRNLFPNQYGEFAVSFLDTLAKTVGPEQVSSILRKQWELKAREYSDRIGEGSLEKRVAKLVELRRSEGYMAEWYRVEESKFIFAEHNCAISEVAESFPSVCDRELEMFAAILPDCTIKRTHWMINREHRCGYLIQARK